MNAQQEAGFQMIVDQARLIASGDPSRRRALEERLNVAIDGPAATLQGIADWARLWAPGQPEDSTPARAAFFDLCNDAEALARWISGRL